jgi:hypothetical protein
MFKALILCGSGIVVDPNLLMYGESIPSITICDCGLLIGLIFF